MAIAVESVEMGGGGRLTEYHLGLGLGPRPIMFLA